MSQYFPPYKAFGENVKVELDFFFYNNVYTKSKIN